MLKTTPGKLLRIKYKICKLAITQSIYDLHPVSTIFPDVNSSTVHIGSPMRIVMAANFCFSKTVFGNRRHFPDEVVLPNPPKCRSQKVGIIKCKSRADRSKPVGLLVCPPAACSAMAARRFGLA